MGEYPTEMCRNITVMNVTAPPAKRRKCKEQVLFNGDGVRVKVVKERKETASETTKKKTRVVVEETIFASKEKHNECMPIINITKMETMGVFFLCGAVAYKEMPSNWVGTCNVGIVMPYFKKG